jgi:hypothetical protein
MTQYYCKVCGIKLTAKNCTIVQTWKIFKEDASMLRDLMKDDSCRVCNKHRQKSGYGMMESVPKTRKLRI